MKIKKVEIQAFRAYDKVVDSTFDFEIGENEYADFVALYAPNGFGKTSFYDAIEWAVTNNIYRFLRRDNLNKAYAQDEKQLKFELDNAKSPHYIIRNKHSKSDLPGFVKIHFLNPAKIQTRDIPRVARVDSTDYSFDSKTTENEFFRDVILSQENIDAFLREDHPETRYVKFMVLFGNKELDQIYNNILYLIKANDSKIAALEKDYTELQLELPLNIDSAVLQKVNETVDELLKHGETIPKINPDSSETDLLNYSNKITERKLSLAGQISRDETHLEKIKAYELKITEYNQSKDRIYLFDKEILSLKNIEVKFKELDELKNRLENNNSQILRATTNKLTLTEIQDILPSYFQSISNILEMEKFTVEQQKSIVSKEDELNSSKSNLSSLKKSLQNTLNEIADLEKQIKSFPELSTLISANLAEVATIKKNIERLILDYNNNSQLINAEDTRVKQKELEILQISKNDFSGDLGAKQHIAILINSLSAEVIKIRQQINKIDNEINNQKHFESELKKLITLGAQIVENSKQEHCPLCSTKYNNHVDLSNAILKNPFLGDAMQKLFEDKSTAEKELAINIDKIQKLKDEILAFKNNELLGARQELQRLVRIKQELEIQITHENNNLKNKEDEGKHNLSQLQGVSIDEYYSKVTNLLKTKLLDSDLLQKNELETSEKLNSLATEIDKLKLNIANAEAIIKNNKSSANYLKIQKFINDFRIDSISYDLVAKLIEEINKSLDSFLEIENLLKTQIADANAIIAPYNITTTEANINLFQQQRDIINSELQATIQVFRETIPNFNVLQTGEVLKEQFDLVKNDVAKKIRESTVIIELLDKAEEFKKNVLPFLTYNKIKANSEKLKNELNFHKNIVGSELKQEKEKLSIFIDNHIQSFFHEDLINKIYQKIDPHPNYKQIKFKCDFSGDKPKMNVFVNGDEGIFVIPNLYFSTAQMNILSLSIFLANALNATDEQNNPIDCIFIDDPIQSMDSINILSTIDLFRSIVVNLNKQIILSTHDENFHSLLKKKIPIKTFKSKYIELETFGKIKR